MRLLLLLLLIGVGAYFTVPTREQHEAAAQEYLQARASNQTQSADQPAPGFSLDSIVDFFTGMVAGQGRYENYYLASKYTVDMPGVAYLECYGAFTMVRCSEVSPETRG